MMGGVEATTDLTGFTLNKGLTSGNYLTNATGLAVSPFYEVEAGTTIDFKLHNGTWESYNKAIFCRTNANAGATLQSTITTSHEQKTAPAETHYCRFAIRIADADDCYAKDVTNNKYLWKGKNV